MIGDEERRQDAVEIARQAKSFLRGSLIPRVDMGVDPERDFEPAGKDFVGTLDGFLDQKDKRGKSCLRDLNSALNRCLAFIQAIRMYDDIKGLAFNDLKIELLSCKIGLEKEIEKFESQGLKMDDRDAFGSDVQRVQALVKLREDKK